MSWDHEQPRDDLFRKGVAAGALEDIAKQGAHPVSHHELEKAPGNVVPLNPNLFEAAPGEAHPERVFSSLSPDSVREKNITSSEST